MVNVAHVDTVWRVFVIMPFCKSPTRDEAQLTSFFENNIKGLDLNILSTDSNWTSTTLALHDRSSADMC